MANEKELVFSEGQIVNLLTAVFQSVNTRISDRIVQEIKSGDTVHNPSADAVKTYTENEIRDKMKELFSVDDELTTETVKKTIADMVQDSGIIQAEIASYMNQFLSKATVVCGGKITVS